MQEPAKNGPFLQFQVTPKLTPGFSCQLPKTMRSTRKIGGRNRKKGRIAVFRLCTKRPSPVAVSVPPSGTESVDRPKEHGGDHKYADPRNIALDKPVVGLFI
jgi:hypothetical protein